MEFHIWNVCMEPTVHRHWIAHQRNAISNTFLIFLKFGATGCFILVMLARTSHQFRASKEIAVCYAPRYIATKKK